MCMKMTSNIEIDHVQAIRLWINETSFDSARIDENFILRFLRVCQFDIEATKKRIISYYDLRKYNHKWFEQSPETDEIVEYFYKNNIGYFITPKDAKGQTVCVFKPGTIDLKKYSLECLMTFFTWLLETHAEDPRFNSMEVHCIIDYKDIGLTFMSKLTPRLLWKTNNWQITMPFEIKSVHVLNARNFIYTLFRLSKFFMNKTFTDRMVYHESGYDSIQEYILPENIPLEYGGTAGPEQIFIDAGIELFKKVKEESECAEQAGQGDGKMTKRKKNKRKKKKKNRK